ncbi:anhydro-N-acetylmuramic acid kinase [Alphaproteobacteria bacterium]|nr:anhydro-N-acetylmuramic acid kinase [Alphaproteobacteria bacterium]GHS98197.1 anhydro-N-acetylmuramic acid kinase [Alphaproteobacteria bacterium]
MKFTWCLGIAGHKNYNGIQASFLSANGDLMCESGLHAFFPYPAALKREMESARQYYSLSAPTDKKSWEHLDKEITNWSLQIAKVLIEKTRRNPDLIGYGGQSLGLECLPRLKGENLGSASFLQAKLKKPLISHFQARDMVNGGTGRFLEASYFQMLVRRAIKEEALKKDAQVAIVDLQEVAQVVLIHPAKDPVAFEAGPGTSLAREIMQRLFQVPDDEYGQVATRGSVHSAWVNKFLKQCDAPVVATQRCDLSAYRHCIEKGLTLLTPLDCMATLSTFSAQLLVKNIQHFEENVQALILTDPSAQNLFFKTQLSRFFPVLTFKDLNWNSDFLESEQCAFNALRVFNHRPISFPTTTGVAQPLSSGVLSLHLGAENPDLLKAAA